MNGYRIYGVEVESKEPADVRGGLGKVEVQRNYGCDGHSHVDWLIHVWFDQDGNVSYAEDISFEPKGVCDGSCSPDNLGGFIYHPTA